MPRVSRSKLSDKELQKLHSYLYNLIASLKNEKEIEGFLDGFLTSEEKVMLTKRLIIFLMLKMNYNISVIQSALHISYETIRTYKNQFPSKNPEFHRILDKLARKETVKQLFRKIDKFLKPLDLALRAKTDMKARARFASGEWWD